MCEGGWNSGGGGFGQNYDNSYGGGAMRGGGSGYSGRGPGPYGCEYLGMCCSRRLHGAGGGATATGARAPRLCELWPLDVAECNWLICSRVYVLKDVSFTDAQ